MRHPQIKARSLSLMYINMEEDVTEICAAADRETYFIKRRQIDVSSDDTKFHFKAHIAVACCCDTHVLR